MGIGRLLEHRRLWKKKPVLALVYHDWFDTLLVEVPRSARVLEVGGGPGFFAEHVRLRRSDVRLVSSDVIATPWSDLACDGESLPFQDASLDAIVAFDLVHHLAQPAMFFREAHRVVRPQGQLLVLEPWVTPFSYPIYRWLHREGCGNPVDPWDPFPHNTDKQPFDGDAGAFTHLLRRSPATRWEELGFTTPRIRLMSGFAYLLSFGFLRPNLLPRPLAPTLIALDRHLEPLAGLIGLRALAVWQRLSKGPGL